MKLSEMVTKLASGEITVKAASVKDDKIVGDKKDLKDTGTVVEDKDKVAKAAKETKELASRAFSHDGQPGDPKALSELYDKTVTRGPAK